jgi:transposase
MTLEEQAATLSAAEIVALLAENAKLRCQVEWFQRQLFGRKSEKRLREPDPEQLSLAGMLTPPVAPADQPPSPTETVNAYQRRFRLTGADLADESELRFDDSVPIQDILLANPAVADLPLDAYEVIGEKVTYRLAQRPGAYVILKYRRPLLKRKDTEAVSCPPAPPAVFEKSFADVSVLAGLLIDKFVYHLPLYRQHQRLQQAGIRLSRGTLTQWVQRAAALVEPIYYALLSSILQSHVLTMDETPLKAGWREKGQLHKGYLWPLYGDKDEVAFPFAASRAQAVVREALGKFCGVLLTDGYIVYERFAVQMTNLVHAQCWSHARRQFEKAQRAEPRFVAMALDRIATFYKEEATIREQGLAAAAKLAHRGEYSKPLVEAFFAWLKQTVITEVLLPTNPFGQAAQYALEREVELKVFLADPEVPIDTNHLEREIRPVALGRKNWLFCWTEIGARQVGIIYSVLASCRLQGVDPYIYLVDVLQRVDTHPALEVHLLTPRLWKQHFAEQPLRSDLDRPRQSSRSPTAYASAAQDTPRRRSTIPATGCGGTK